MPEDHAILGAKNDYLTGEHDKIIKTFRVANEFLENTNISEIIARGNQRNSLREIHRVVYLVEKITNESMVICKNSFSLNYSENLIPAHEFTNPWRELDEISQYVRFQKPNSEEILRFMAVKKTDEKVNFLRSCENSKNEFSIVKDYTGLNFFVKSVAWPGFVNYFRANSPIFGHIYFGTGLKNVDLHFTIN